MCILESPDRSVLALQVLTEGNYIPPNAVPFSEDANGCPLYIARALLEVRRLLYSCPLVTYLNFRDIFVSTSCDGVVFKAPLTLSIDLGRAGGHLQGATIAYSGREVSVRGQNFSF